MKRKPSLSKFAIGWIACFLFRLIPFRPPNLEPLMATIMPFSKRYGWAMSFAFGFFSIALFDLAEGRVGAWTWITGASYGAVGIGAYIFFKRRKSSAGNYLKYSTVATVLYDAATGLTVGPLFFGQSFTLALVGQIPFTIFHLLGNTAFALAFSPVLYKWVADGKEKEARIITERAAVKVP
jgi:hypothetical protein